MIEDLAIDKTFWPILALDHGLTGYDNSVPIADVPKLLRGCQGTIGSVVMTYGMARHLGNKITEVPLIIQCFGAPHSFPKIKVCDVDQASNLGAKGIAIQVDFSLPEKYLTNQIYAISEIVRLAHEIKMPVLFMVAHKALRDFNDFAQIIRFCLEMGADLIKIRLDQADIDRTNKFEDYRYLLRNAPPVLLAGGKISENIFSEVRTAKILGFSGFCIGRNIYQSDNPVKTSRLLYNAWHDDN